jgi:hypothetical protein
MRRVDIAPDWWVIAGLVMLVVAGVFGDSTGFWVLVLGIVCVGSWIIQGIILRSSPSRDCGEPR